MPFVRKLESSLSSPLTISELTDHITAILNQQIGLVSLIGEISGYKIASSGHRYFTLKDDQAQIDCVLWESRELSFLPCNGMKVIVTGKLKVYAPKGKYQLDCTNLIPSGAGELYLAYERLKQDLHTRGYFDRQQPLPQLPLYVGIVTSPTGAALQDMLTTLKRRAPHIQVFFCPASVQGDKAPQEIARGVTLLNQALKHLRNSVIIIGRGGGSIEDLWAFNTPIVAESIYQSELAVISAVGHETDYTIADFVADHRVATPTAAAELVSKSDRGSLLTHIQALENKMTQSTTQVIQSDRQKIHQLINSYGYQKIRDRISNYAQHLDELESDLTKYTERAIETKQIQLTSLTAHMQSLHPLSPLKRGFALLKQSEQFVPDHQALDPNQPIDIIRSSEIAHATIQSVEPILENSDGEL